MVTDWKKIVVSPIESIREAWRALDNSGLRIVLVVEADRLAGVATDGDIRRGLLKEAKLEDSIQDVMNSFPLTVAPGLSKIQLITMMEEQGILAIPVVDNGMLVGVEILQDLLYVPKVDNPVFLMAGGFGKRLRPLTDNCPKPMLKVGSKPMLEIAIEGFKKSGFHNFFISTHYMPEIIRDYFGDGSDRDISITYIHEEKPLGTGGALGLLPAEAKNGLPIIVMNGDVLTNTEFRRVLDFHIKHNAQATMCVRDYDYKIPYGVVNGNGNNVVSMEEKPTKRFSVNAGIYVISPEIIASVPRNKKIDLPSLLEDRMAENKAVLMFSLHEYWLDIGRIDDFNRAQTDIYSLGLI